MICMYSSCAEEMLNVTRRTNFSGKVVAVNEDASDNSGFINSSPMCEICTVLFTASGLMVTTSHYLILQGIIAANGIAVSRFAATPHFTAMNFIFHCAA